MRPWRSAHLRAMTAWQPTRRSPSAVPLLAQARQRLAIMPSASVARSAAAWRMPIPAAQLPLLAVLLDAEVLCRSIAGERDVPAADFFQSLMTTALEPGEADRRRALSQNAAAHGLGLRGVQPSARRFRHCRGRRAARARWCRQACSALRLCRRRHRRDAGSLRCGDGGSSRATVRRRPGSRPWRMLHGTAARSKRPRIPAVFRKELVHALTQRTVTAARDRARGSLRP